MSLKAIKKSFPKTIDFLKIKLYNTDTTYEHEIISRFEHSILNTFETLYQNKDDSNKEIISLKKEIEEKENKLKALIEVEGSLERVNSFFEDLSSMLLSKNFNAKVDHQVITWLRSVFGDKIYHKLSGSGSSRKKKKIKSRSKVKEKQSFMLFNEILEIVTTIIESSQNTTNDNSTTKLEYIRAKLTEELKKDFNNTIKFGEENSFFSEIQKSPETMKNKTFRIIDDTSSVQSELA